MTPLNEQALMTSINSSSNSPKRCGWCESTKHDFINCFHSSFSISKHDSLTVFIRHFNLKTHHFAKQKAGTASNCFHSFNSFVHRWSKSSTYTRKRHSFEVVQILHILNRLVNWLGLKMIFFDNRISIKITFKPI